MTKTLKDELAEAIESWLNTRKNSSLQVLVNRSNVGYSTLRRIVQKEVEASLTVAIQICSVIFERKEGALFIMKHFPETGLLYSEQAENNVVPIISDTKIKLSRDDFHVLSLAATENGISRDALFKKVGERGNQSATKLIDLGIVSENLHGILKATEDSFRFIDVEVLLDELRHLVELFDQSKLDQWGSLIHIKTEGLTLEAKREAHKILTDALTALSNFLRDKKNHGPYVVAYGIISTILSSPELSEGQA